MKVQIARIGFTTCLIGALLLSASQGDAKTPKRLPKGMLTQSELVCQAGGVLAHAIVSDFQQGNLLTNTILDIRTIVPRLFSTPDPGLAQIFVDLAITVFTDGQARDAGQMQRDFEAGCLAPATASQAPGWTAKSAPWR